MRKEFIGLILLFQLACISTQVNAQRPEEGIISLSERKGDKNFYNFSYADAITHYLDALAKDSARTILKLKIADSYRKLNDPVNAAIWFGQALTDSTLSPEPHYLLYYAQALSSNQEYEEAKTWYLKYQSVMQQDKLALYKIEGINNLDKFYRDSASYKISQVSINSQGLDFSPMWYDKGIVFVSSRTENPIAPSIFSWDKTSYLDLYYAEAKEGGDLEAPVIFNKRVNTKYHEGPLSFFYNQTKVVFTRNNFLNGIARRSEEGITKLELYFAEKSADGDWNNIKPFQYNNTEFSVGHPTITEDGKKMYFVSDMPGGYGATDIYVTYFVDGQWTAPKNLGAGVNTSGREMFPYLNNDHLYFSSDGHEGLGGLDIYRAELVDDTPASVTNLGYPISSSYDDFSLVIDKQGRYGYFSTNRDNKVHDNIYYFLYSKEAYAYLRGKVIDNHFGTPVPAATVSLFDHAANTIKDTLTDTNGEFEFRIVTNRKYMLEAAKRGYKSVNTESALAEHEDDIIEDVVLKLEPPHHVISITVIDEDTREIIPDALVHVLDTDNNEVVEISLRESLHHEFETKGGSDYRATGSKNGYFNNVLQISVGYDHVYDTLFYQIPIRRFEIGKAIKLDNIYYDLDRADIRQDAAVELDKLVKVLTDNPKIKIELSSHTDSRGSDSYNLDLSQRRAESAVAYIISKGIQAERIVAKGYGETQLVNRCANGVSCTTGQHQENRRTEFKVISN